MPSEVTLLVKDEASAASHPEVAKRGQSRTIRHRARGLSAVPITSDFASFPTTVSNGIQILPVWGIESPTRIAIGMMNVLPS